MMTLMFPGRITTALQWGNEFHRFQHSLDVDAIPSEGIRTPKVLQRPESQDTQREDSTKGINLGQLKRPTESSG
jgi:hypothetical protein